ncbi:hypothetical protein CSN65_003320 [Salmonella enterica subsp. diarizonae]|nr:hypothetical protein [Salmonella enterica subsp. diarizonae]
MNRKQASSQFPLYYRTVLALAIAVALGGGTASAGEKLDMSFIQGGGDMDPEIWAVLNGSYAPGRYLVDLILNGKDTGKQILDVTPQDSEELCLPEAWLTKAGVYISLDYFRDGYDTTRQCYVLTKAPSVNVDFDRDARLTLKAGLMVDGKKVVITASQRGEDVVISVPAATRLVELRSDAPVELEVPANYRGNLQVPVEVEGIKTS